MRWSVLRVVVGSLFICVAAGVLGAAEPATLVRLQVKDRAEQDRCQEGHGHQHLGPAHGEGFYSAKPCGLRCFWLLALGVDGESGIAS